MPLPPPPGYAEPAFQERRDLACLRKERFTVNLIESLSV